VLNLLAGRQDLQVFKAEKVEINTEGGGKVEIKSRKEKHLGQMFRVGESVVIREGEGFHQTVKLPA
jgi:hypothetical protein